MSLLVGTRRALLGVGLRPNLMVNPSASVNATDGTVTHGSGTTTITRDTGEFRTDPASFKAVTNGAASNQGYQGGTAPFNTQAVRTFSGWVWLKAPAATALQVFLRAFYTDASSTAGVVSSITATGDWQQVAPAAVTTVGNKQLTSPVVIVRTAGALAVTFNVDDGHIQEDS